MFKRIRKQAKMALADFSAVGVSSSTISDFECGKSMMSFERVDACLSLAGSSLEEYEIFLNFYTESPSVSLLYEVERAMMCNDREKMHELLEISRNETNSTHITIILKVLLKDCSSSEILDYVDLLYDVEIWGYKEIFTFYILVEYLTTQDILNIMTNLRQRSSGRGASSYKRILTLTYCQIIIILSCRLEEVYSQKIIEYIEEEELADTMFLKNLFIGTKGFWVYKFKDKVNGRKMMEQFMEIQKLVGRPDVTSFYQHKYESLL